MAEKARKPNTERHVRLESENTELRDQLHLLTEVQNRLGMLSEKFVLINRLSQEMNILDLETIGQLAVSKIPALIGARYASMFLFEYDKNELVLQSHNHPETISERISVTQHRNTVMGLALARKRIVHIEDIEHYEKTHGIKFTRTFADKYATRSCISAPLLAGQFTVGVINFADKIDAGCFSEIDDVPVVEQLTQVLAMAVRNCTLYREVQSQARTDSLTKLANRRAFLESLGNELRRCARYMHPLTLLLIDVDDFKRINDRHGHPAGDAVLTQIAGALGNSVRREDVTARHGGDEFAVLLIETSIQTAGIVAARLTHSVSSQQFTFNGESIPVTISVGAAAYKPGMTAHDLVHAADQVMLLAKQRGKNQFVVAD